MPRLRSTVVPVALATLSLAVAAGPASAASSPAASSPAAALKQVATRDAGSSSAITDVPTLVTRLLGLPGQGSISALLETLGVPQDQAAELARQISRLPTALTVPGGLGG